MRKYFTVIEKVPGGEWTPQFGDYKRVVCMEEVLYMKESAFFVKGTKIKIIETADSQTAVLATIALLNTVEKEEETAS